MVIGVDVAPLQDSPVTPQINSLSTASGKPILVTHGRYDSNLSAKLGGKTVTSASLATLTNLPKAGGKPVDFNVNVSATNNTQGPFVVTFYLPGDTKGNGTVSQSDLKTIRSAMGSHYGDSRYVLNADTNRDGIINGADMNVARENLGVKTVVDPNVTGQIDTSLITDPLTRGTNQSSMPFSGTATPGAVVAVSEIANKVPTVTTTADSTGNFSTNLPLAQGSNTFSVVVSDGFLQKNQGALLPIVYTPPS
jgi:hypothetical protein